MAETTNCENWEMSRRLPVERRQWAVEKSIAWCKASEDTTADMLDSAALIERFVVTGEHSPVVAMAALETAMAGAVPHTRAVSRAKARAVCVEIMNRLPN